jgi:hypothetical protein
MAFSLFGGGLGHYILLGALLIGVFFIYLLFTQPNNALYYAEKVITVVGKILWYLVLGIVKVITGIANFIGNLIRRKR